MKKTFALFGFTFLLVLPALLKAQTPSTAFAAADSMQHLRHMAGALYEKQNPTKAELEQAIKLLKSAVHFLDSIPVIEMGEGSLYLKFRKSDVTRDLVYAYVLNHQNAEAIAALKTQFNEGTSFAILQMETDSAFSTIKSDPAFIAMMDKYKARLALWGGQAFKTPLQPDLPMAEKIAGLSLLWTQARANFVYFDKLSADWNQTYIDFIPQVIATKNTLEYYKVLQKFYAQLHDGHSNVYFPPQLSKEVNSKPPLSTKFIEGKVFITAVRNDSLQKAGIVPGLEILKIDNMPVKLYADTYVKPYASSPSPQDMVEREFTYYLLNGAADKPLTLELSDLSGKITTRTLARSGYPKVKPVPAMEYREIDHVGYLTIHNFEDQKIIKQFDSLFTEIDKTRGLIIDVRDNGGGDSGIGNQILAKLTDKQFQLFSYEFARYDSQGNSLTHEPMWTKNDIPSQWPDKNHFYNKPVVILINAATFSAAEDFVVAFDCMKRGKLIGQTTAGSTGQPVSFSLPGGGTARVCGKRETYPDGKEFVDIGIKPDIFVNPTINDLYNGTDAVLQKALEVLK